MWDRSELKASAKRALRTNGYGIAVLAVFLAVILAGLISFGTSGTTGRIGLNFNLNWTLDGSSEATPPGGAERLGQIAEEELALAMAQLREFLLRNLPLFLSIFAFASLAGIAYQALIANPIVVGLSLFFLEHRTRRSQISRLLWAFREGYVNMVRVMFLRALFIWAWSLLLYIPGLVKSYQYRMVPYILTEQPHIGWREALRLSRRMTAGEKGRMFVLDLSFLGWYLLLPLTLGLGIFFLLPYIEQVQAELYAALRPKGGRRDGQTVAKRVAREPENLAESRRKNPLTGNGFCAIINHNSEGGLRAMNTVHSMVAAYYYFYFTSSRVKVIRVARNT